MKVHLLDQLPCKLRLIMIPSVAFIGTLARSAPRTRPGVPMIIGAVEQQALGFTRQGRIVTGLKPGKSGCPSSLSAQLSKKHASIRRKPEWDSGIPRQPVSTCGSHLYNSV